MREVRCINTGEVFKGAEAAANAIHRDKTAVYRAINTGKSVCGNYYEYVFEDRGDIYDTLDNIIEMLNEIQKNLGIK